MPDFEKDIKIKQKLEPPAQSAPYIVNLPQPPVRNAEEYLKAYIGYVYTAVGAIAQEVASIDLHLYQAKFVNGKPKTTEIFEHPALSVLHYVNDLSTFYDLVEATQTYLELTGEAFWVILKDTTGTPKEIWLLRPDWVKVIPSKTEVIDHYNYYAGGVITEKVEIPKENIIPFKYFHPMNPYRGKGSTQAAALPFDILNFAQEYNRNFFFNSALPSMVFSTDQKISEQTTRRFLEQWQQTFGGRSKSNKIAFLGNGLKLDKVSMGAKELDFNEQMKTMRDDVLAVFKVPKTVLGLTEDVNRANAQATTAAFMERVITPRMRKFVNSLNEFFLPAFTKGDRSYFLDFTDPSPEDVELKLKRYENGRKYGWLTPNEIRAEENLEPLEGGDELSMDSAPEAPKEPNMPQEMPADEPEDQNPDEPVKPTGEEGFQPRGFKANLIKMLGGQVLESGKKTYTPPAYLLKKRPVKHMVNLPVRRLEVLQTEKMVESFIGPLKKFIAELVAQDEYSPLEKKRAKGVKLEDIFVEAFDKAKKDKENEDNAHGQSDSELTSGWDDAKKDSHWNAFSDKAYKDEKDILETSQEVFKKQEKLVLDKLEDSGKAWRKVLGKKTVVADVLPTLPELSRMWDSLETLLTDIYTKRGQEALDDLIDGMDFNITTEFSVQYLDEYSGVLIKEINTTTRDALRATLAEGFDAGESIPKLAKRVMEVFAEANTVRALAIARSESIRAANTASVEAYRQSGVVEAKEWLAQRDGRTCPFCEDLDGKTISLNKYYAKIGDTLEGTNEEGEKVYMKVEYTNIGEPPAHTNCRCFFTPIYHLYI